MHLRPAAFRIRRMGVVDSDDIINEDLAPWQRMPIVIEALGIPECSEQ